MSRPRATRRTSRRKGRLCKGASKAGVLGTAVKLVQSGRTRAGSKVPRSAEIGWQGPTADGQTQRMARILVTEKIADGGLDRLRAAGHDVDLQLDLSAGAAPRRRGGRPRPDHPLGHHGHRRRAGRRPGPRRGRPGRHRARQRRHRRRHAAGRDGRERRRSRTSSPPPSTRWRCCWPRPATSPRPTRR